MAFQQLSVPVSASKPVFNSYGPYERGGDAAIDFLGSSAAALENSSSDSLGEIYQDERSSQLLQEPVVPGIASTTYGPLRANNNNHC